MDLLVVSGPRNILTMLRKEFPGDDSLDVISAIQPTRHENHTTGLFLQLKGEFVYSAEVASTMMCEFLMNSLQRKRLQQQKTIYSDPNVMAA